MSPVFLVIVVLLCYFCVRLGAKAGFWIVGGRYRAYRQLALRTKGRYESRGLGEPPTVSFYHQDSAFRVGLAPTVPGQNNPPRTRVVARFRRGLPFRLELAPVSRPAPAQPPKGTRAVRVGDREFDQAFVVQANDQEMACAFLSQAVRWSIGNLQRLAPPGGLLISVNPERMLIQVDRNLAAHPESLFQTVREARDIHDGLLGGVADQLAQGVAIVEVGPNHDPSGGPPICKVCGELIEPPTVLCIICRTPHHRDCWEYVGSCSIYGCTGKQSVPG